MAKIAYNVTCAEESAEKMLQASSLCRISNEARSVQHFFGTFLGAPFGAGTFRSTFSAFLSGWGSSIVRGLLGTGPPEPTLESASPSPPQGSIWHRFDIDSILIRHRNRVKSGNQCRIDVKSMPNRPLRSGEGEVDSRVGSGGLFLINPSQLQHLCSFLPGL